MCLCPETKAAKHHLCHRQSFSPSLGRLTRQHVRFVQMAAALPKPTGLVQVECNGLLQVECNGLLQVDSVNATVYFKLNATVYFKLNATVYFKLNATV